MILKIENLFMRWKRIIEKSGSLELADPNKDYNLISTFIRQGNPRKIAAMVADCRDCSLASEFDSKKLLYLINKLLRNISKHLRPAVSQSCKYISATRRMFDEKIRCLNGRPLRTIDVSIEDGSTSRLVRRIVEKRMSQAYYRQSRGSDGQSNRSRHYRDRAVSFQLHNIGQIEDVDAVERMHSTHWKEMYDEVTGQTVLKKKMGYTTLSEAEAAAERWRIDHPEDKLQVVAYQCTHCNKYHIGHNRLSYRRLATA